MAELELPPGWVDIRLADVLRSPLASGRSKASGANGRWTVLRPTALSLAGVDCRDVDESVGGAGRRDPVLARAGNFLICRSAGTLDRLGRGALVGDGFAPVALPSSMMRVQVRPEILHPEYLGHLWRSSLVRDQLEAAAVGGRMRSLAIRALKEVRLPLPPLAEQHRILDILRERLRRLDRGGEALSRAAAGVTLLQNAAHGALAPSCDAPFQSLPPGWSWGQLGDVIKRIEAGRSLKYDRRPASSDEWGVVKTSAMTRGVFHETENKAVRAGARIDEGHEIKVGDILLCRANTPDHIGAAVQVAACRPRLLLSDKSLRLVPEQDIDGRWLAQLLATSYVRTQISQRSRGALASMQNISQAGLRNIPIPIPPPDEQKRLGQRATAWTLGGQRLHPQVQQAQEMSEQLRQALTDAACTGRLVGPAGVGTPQRESALPVRPDPSPWTDESIGRWGHRPDLWPTADRDTKTTIAAVQLELEL
ncbi:restriction endonuclease subunit S [Streptomyces inhibens]|uniref:restriction endonuclease subunit S n=1 Tax=Streptomyces inhibens TaxID=2293571 RepID=UPI00402A7D94